MEEIESVYVEETESVYVEEIESVYEEEIETVCDCEESESENENERENKTESESENDVAESATGNENARPTEGLSGRFELRAQAGLLRVEENGPLRPAP